MVITLGGRKQRKPNTEMKTEKIDSSSLEEQLKDNHMLASLSQADCKEDGG